MFPFPIIGMSVSLVIPVLNEAPTIGAVAASLAALRGQFEVVIVDGGSTDDTIAQAEACGLRVISTARGRGIQMNAGAAATSGETLLFLHADTCLPENALLLIEAALSESDVCGGHFRLCFAGTSWGAQTLTRLYPLFIKLGLVYGDSGLFVRRSVFEALDGYRDWPLFEDCDFYQRLRRTGRFVQLPATAITSSRRFEGRFLRTFVWWTLLQVMYWLGVAPQRLAQMYRVAR